MRTYPVTVQYLQVKSLSQIKSKRSTKTGLTVRSILQTEPDLVRFLYREVGERWYWVRRYFWSLQEWGDRLAGANVSFWVLESSGSPAGYYELEAQEFGDIEVVNLGLLANHIGSGLGAHLVTDALERAFSLGSVRSWLHTCSLDHPHALSNYQDRGMELYKTENDLQPIPEDWPMPDQRND